MAGQKKVPVEVVLRAKEVVTKQYTVAPPPRPTAPARPRAKSAVARDKVVAALKRLHPMD